MMNNITPENLRKLIARLQTKLARQSQAAELTRFEIETYRELLDKAEKAAKK